MNESVKLSEIVANDDGSSYQKVAFYAKKDGRLVIETQKYPTNISRGRIFSRMGQGSGNSRIYVVNGTEFTISPSQDGYDVREVPDHQFSDGLIACNQYALEMAGFGGKGITCINGLPIETFFLGEKLVNVQRKMAAFEDAVITNAPDDSGKLTKVDESRLVTIKRSVVMPEAVGAYYDMLFNDDGSTRDPMEGRTIVVDMGSYTTDVCIINENRDIDNQYILTLKDRGFMWIFDNVVNALKANMLDTDFSEIPTNVLETAVTTGKLEQLGANKDVSDIVDPVISECVGVISRELFRVVGTNLSWMRRIIAVGGGANLIKQHFGKYSELVTVPDDNQFSNARGFLKFLVWGPSGLTIEDDL